MPYNVHTFEFAFPDATYTIEGVSQSISEEENGDKFEYLSAEIGDECSVIIDALRSTLDTNVTLTLRGDTGYYAFSMKRPMREAIVRTWDLFIEAGGESHLTEADEPDFSIR